ncbi:MAG: N-acetylmuramoyl-L-alanine amidase [Micromonosporaceae bacterium]
MLSGVRAAGLALVTAGSLVTAPAPALATTDGAVRPHVQHIQLGTRHAPESGARRTGEALVFRRDRVRGFSAYGVSWAHRDGLDVSVTGRVRRAGSWTPWQPLDVDASPRPGATRAGSGLVWTGPSHGIEIAVRAAGADPPRLRLDLIDPRDLPADHRPATTSDRRAATASDRRAVPVGDRASTAGGTSRAPQQPEIVRRAGWGADESKMTWQPEYADTLSAITLHHTATSSDYRAEDVPKIMRSIYQYHAVSLEWGDIGYHVLVDRFGRLWEGRTGGLDKPVIGAHAGGFNDRTAGISMIGTYTETEVPDEVVDAAARYIAWRFAPYGIDPRGSTRLTGGPNTKYDSRVTVTVPRVFPHRETSRTECPGEQGMAVLGRIREAAYRYGE